MSVEHDDRGRILTDDVDRLQEDVTKDVEVQVATALDATEGVAITSVAKRDVLGVDLVELVADGELNVGNSGVRGELVTALLIVVGRALDGT